MTPSACLEKALLIGSGIVIFVICDMFYKQLVTDNSIFSIGLAFCPFLFGLEMRDKYSRLLAMVGLAAHGKAVFGGAPPSRLFPNAGEAGAGCTGFTNSATEDS